MYAECGSMEDAQRVFNKMPSRDVVTWTAMIVGHVKCSQGQKALELFRQMQQEDVQPDSVTFMGVLNACASVAVLEEGRCVHEQIIESGQKALELFRQMQKEGVQADSVTFVGVLNACASIAALEEGRCIHEQIIESGWDSDVFVGSSLVDMYAKCGSLEDAWRVFTKMPSRNVVTWNAIILGHVKCGQGQKALGIFQQMQQEDVQPDSVTFMGVVNHVPV
ncbi:unnamed protein product [Sphagnum jensenii]|uniref:Pentatricopeptide repeat-containing protein n=1 Tax=Sphagnum jensenii TaxID=128206 RepID=A0ABP1BE89_9BRYO